MPCRRRPESLNRCDRGDVDPQFLPILPITIDSREASSWSIRL